jgi:hypothetical protein
MVSLPFSKGNISSQIQSSARPVPFKHKILALVPAPGLIIFAHAAQADLIGQLLPGEGEQCAAEPLALTFRDNKKLVEIHLRQMQREHGHDRTVVGGDKKAAALFDLVRNAGA